MSSLVFVLTIHTTVEQPRRTDEEINLKLKVNFPSLPRLSGASKCLGGVGRGWGGVGGHGQGGPVRKKQAQPVGVTKEEKLRESKYKLVQWSISQFTHK